MESHQIFGIGTTTTTTSSTSPPTLSSLPGRLIESLKFELGNSPASPFSTQFDSDSVTTLSDYSSSSPQPNYASRTDFEHALLELESALMGPDDDAAHGRRPHEFLHPTPALFHDQSQAIPAGPIHRQRSTPKRQKSMELDSPRQGRRLSLSPGPVSGGPEDLKQLLKACARALSENNTEVFDRLIEKAKAAVSISGEPVQRLGAYMVEGMVARKEASGVNIYRALQCREPESKELLSYMQMLYEICPYLKFGYMAANGAIAEACRNEDRIHIIDFQIGQGTQWLTLLQALAARPNGPPLVRITGIDDAMNQFARGEGLAAVGRRLAAVSRLHNISVEFHPVPVFAPDVTPAMLGVRPGEALAVNFPLQLHHTADESVDVTNPRDGLLRMVRGLSPRVVTLVEQESNTNTTPFYHRFAEALEYYLAMFESIDEVLPRESKDRINVEQHCLARDIVNVVACEGAERVERHELFGKWKSRLTMAGFRQYPLSSYVNSVIRSLLRCYSRHYTLAEKDGAMLLGWKDRNLISASAWH